MEIHGYAHTFVHRTPIRTDADHDRRVRSTDSDESEPTDAERVRRFLVQNRENAYKATVIADATGVAENSSHPTLNRLAARDLVRHKEPYWAIGDLEHGRNTFVFLPTAGFLNGELGSESRAEWPAAAEGTDDEGRHAISLVSMTELSRRQ